MQAQGQPQQASVAQVSTTGSKVAKEVIAAEASAPAGAFVGEKIAQGYAAAPVGHATAERAVGQAAVQRVPIEADVSQMSSSLGQVSVLEQERVEAERMAQQALAEAAALMEQARMREKIAQEASAKARIELSRAEAELDRQGTDVMQRKEAEANRARALAELEAREAARKKAEEEAALQAAKLAAAEEAEADAAKRVAEARYVEAAKAKNEMLAKAESAKYESAAATQRAADLTAQAEARNREAQLVQQDVQVAKQQLRQQASTASSVGSSDVGKVGTLTAVAGGLAAGGAAGALAGGALAGGGSTMTMAQAQATDQGTFAQVKEVPASQVAQLQQQQSGGVMPVPAGQQQQNIAGQSAGTGTGAAAGTGSEFTYILHARVTRADLPRTGLPNLCILRFAIGDVEAVSDPASPLDPTQWQLQASMPIRRPTDLLSAELLDATGPTKAVLGRVFVKIDGLTDGHISRDNNLTFDRGGTCTVTLNLEPWQKQFAGAGAGQQQYAGQQYAGQQQYSAGQQQPFAGQQGYTGSAGSAAGGAPFAGQQLPVGLQGQKGYTGSAGSAAGGASSASASGTQFSAVQGQPIQPQPGIVQY